MPRINFQNPAIQSRLVKLAQKQGTGSQRRNLIRRYSGAEGRRLMGLEMAGRDRALQERMFNSRLALAKSKLAQSRSELKDAARGANLAFGLGIGQLGLGYLDSRRAAAERAKQADFRRRVGQQIITGYGKTGDNRGLTSMLQLYPEYIPYAADRGYITEEEYEPYGDARYITEGE